MPHSSDSGSKKPPAAINPAARRTANQWSLAQYVEGVRAGNRVALGRAITLVESDNPADRKRANELLTALLPNTGNSFRLGITGVPGVGKSTFIEYFGQALIATGKRIAVLAVDPSSRVSQGSILGDKTRMNQLGLHSAAFVRPSPAGTTLGGIANASRETLLLCEAAGFDFIIVETVGVGQSETAVADMVDCFLLLLLPGAGDELQGIKRGIVELADILAVNKSDGDLVNAAKRAQQEYRRALHLFPPKPNGWHPEVLTCSATSGMGVDKIQAAIEKFRTTLLENGYLEKQRRQQQRQWLRDLLRTELLRSFEAKPALRQLRHRLETEVVAGRMVPQAAVGELLRRFKSESV